MIATIQFNIDARRSKDTEALAVELERIFRQHTVGDGDLDHTGVRPGGRGGKINFWATVEGEREDIQARYRAIAEAVDTNMNLIDRVDEYAVAAHADSKLVGFAQGDYRGWLRQAALDDLKAARS